MSLDLDPYLILKIAAGCIAVVVFFFSMPMKWGKVIQRFMPSGDPAPHRTDCKTVDHAWRSLVNASVEGKDSTGVDLLNQWMSGYNTQNLEQKS